MPDLRPGRAEIGDPRRVCGGLGCFRPGCCTCDVGEGNIERICLSRACAHIVSVTPALTCKISILLDGLALCLI